MLINQEPWFVGKDVAEALGYANTRDALRVHVDDEDKADVVIHDGRQNRTMAVLINESGLYSLILSSKLPSAKAFKRWVTGESRIVTPNVSQSSTILLKKHLINRCERKCFFKCRHYTIIGYTFVAFDI